jgi:hypothetical protein
MRKFTKLLFARNGLTALALAIPALALGQTIPPNCKALVQVDNNLWLSQGGATLRQVTNDMQFRSAAALSPDGKIIAYSGKNSPDDITFLDNSGRLITNLDLHAQDSIVAMEWVSPTLLRADEHIGPAANRSHFVRVASGSPSLIPGDSSGGMCAISPDLKNMACTTRDALTLNDRDIFYSTSAFASASTLQTIDMAVGSSVISSTSPSFRIEVREIDSKDKTVQLRITTPDGLWQEQRVPAGGTMPVTADEKAGNPPSVFGFMPVFGNNPGAVRLYIKKSNTGAWLFEGHVAWDPRGKRIAVVEASGLGQRTWLLVNREMGQADNGKGGVDAREQLPIDGPIKKIAFTSDTHIRIEGATQAFEKDIPAQGKVPAGTPYRITQAMPGKISVNVGGNSVIADVKGLACQ